MSVNLASMIQRPAGCCMVFGDYHEGTLETVDAGFNTVLSGVGDPTSEAVTPYTFVRGDNIVYIAFHTTASQERR